MILAGSALVGTNAEVARAAHAFGSDTIKVGLIGCGRRGTTIADQMLAADSSIQLVAFADAFKNNLHTAYRTLRSRHGDKIDSQHKRFDGVDGYLGVMASEADVLILATPPAFRPVHFEAAVAADKHMMMEKPLGIDGPGVRRILAANESAVEKKLNVRVGLQRRHDPRYKDCVQQIQHGAVGQLSFARAFWNMTPLTQRDQKDNQSLHDHQLRNWQQFPSLGGDLITEHHVHNLDVINWVLGDHPIAAQGHGGPLVNQDGNDICEEYMVEYTYAGGVRLLSQCRRKRAAWNGIGEFVHGSQGYADISAAKIYDQNDQVIWQSSLPKTKALGSDHQQADFIETLRSGAVVNEVASAASSTLTAIMGRMAANSGRIVRWSSVLD